MKMTIKNIGIISYAKIVTIGFAVFGFFYGLSLSLLLKFGTTPVSEEDQILRMLGFWLILIAPVIYALLGFILAVVTAWLYNIFASWVGGIEVELEKK